MSNDLLGDRRANNLGLALYGGLQADPILLAGFQVRVIDPVQDQLQG